MPASKVIVSLQIFGPDEWPGGNFPPRPQWPGLECLCIRALVDARLLRIWSCPVSLDCWILRSFSRLMECDCLPGCVEKKQRRDLGDVMADFWVADCNHKG